MAELISGAFHEWMAMAAAFQDAGFDAAWSVGDSAGHDPLKQGLSE